MTQVKLPAPSVTHSWGPAQETILQNILGVAIFDCNGLPKEYYITADHDETNWVQMVFQALGLKLLLSSELELGEFEHLLINASQHVAMVFSTTTDYVALLLREPISFSSLEQTQKLTQWVAYFEAELLRQQERFIPA
jgi:predicted regulator of Ras-like GTPase activity (Roadblock/LC7/MglB family)